MLDMLLPMPNVTAIKNKDPIILYKDGAMFGKILVQSILFLSESYCQMLCMKKIRQHIFSHLSYRY